LSIVTMKQLLEVGVHFGHQTRKWNPKMKKYIYTAKNGIYIIDLQQTMQLIVDAYDFVKDLAADGGKVLFVGTKKQTQDTIENYARDCAMPYVKNRWLGGTLTNFETINKRTKRLLEIEEMEENGVFEKLPKKEVLGIRKEYEKLLYNIGGIRDMKKLPEALYIVDPTKEAIGVNEAKKLGIPIIAITDTNCDPDDIDYVIPGNDDAIRSCALITSIIADAVKKGSQEKIKIEKSPEEEAEDTKKEEAAKVSEQGPQDNQRVQQ